MFSRLFRGRRVPPLFPAHPFDEPIRIDEARLHAWALALNHEAVPRRRPPHRADLPDVDIARAVPVPRRPGPIARMIRRVMPARTTASPDPPEPDYGSRPRIVWAEPGSEGAPVDASYLLRDRAA